MPFVGELDTSNIRVQPPTSVIFLCGGQISSIDLPAVKSMRDAFLKIADFPLLRKREVVQAEDVTASFEFSSIYDDLLLFETDFAQITELVLLFCESQGSLAELGAFSMVNEIASRLLVIIRDKHWLQDSFVKLGPLKSLESRFGAEAVYVMEDLDVGLRGDAVDGIKLDVLKTRLTAPLELRLSKLHEPSTFDRQKAGHVIKLIVGLVQEYGALTIDEITYVLFIANVTRTEKEIKGYLLCAKTVRWITERRMGTRTYYFAIVAREGANLVWNEGSEARTKTRRRFLIREHWKEVDELRFRGIVQVQGEGQA